MRFFQSTTLSLLGFLLILLPLRFLPLHFLVLLRFLLSFSVFFFFILFCFSLRILMYCWKTPWPLLHHAMLIVYLLLFGCCLVSKQNGACYPYIIIMFHDYKLDWVKKSCKSFWHPKSGIRRVNAFTKKLYFWKTLCPSITLVELLITNKNIYIIINCFHRQKNILVFATLTKWSKWYWSDLRWTLVGLKKYNVCNKIC